MLFTDLDIIKPIQKALKEEGYLNPTPIQSKSITPLLEGRDLLGCHRQVLEKQHLLQYL